MTGPILRASSSGRWFYCPESAWLEQQYDDGIASESAKSGTAAHEMGELVLTSQVTPQELVDRQASNGVVWDDEMVPHVQMYVDHIRSRGAGYWIEKSIKIETPHRPVTGTCDGATFNFVEIEGHLFIDDFKYGHGLIEAVENWQLLIYAIGIAHQLMQSGKTVNKITMAVLQPRGFHPDGPIRSWTISINELADYNRDLHNAVSNVMDETRQCVTGPFCRYCKRLPFCNTAIDAAMNAVDISSKAIPDDSSPEQIGYLLDTFERSIELLEHLKSAITTRAEIMITKENVKIPGRTMAPTKGHAKFTDKKVAKGFAQAMGISIIEPEKLCTPAEAKRRGLDVSTISHQPTTAPKLTKSRAPKKANKEFKND